MKFTKILRTTALAASLAAVLGLAAAPSAMADTATGNTQFTVKLSPVTLLYYYSQINLTLDSTAMLAVAGGSPGTIAATALTATSGNVAGGAVSLSAGITPSAVAGINAVGLDITNAWAVRSVTTPTSGKTSVTVAFSGGPTATLTGAVDTTSTIGLSNAGTNVAPFTGTGLGGVQLGDIKMNMNLSNAKTADTYGTATIVITATST